MGKWRVVPCTRSSEKGSLSLFPEVVMPELTLKDARFVRWSHEERDRGDTQHIGRKMEMITPG